MMACLRSSNDSNTVSLSPKYMSQYRLCDGLPGTSPPIFSVMVGSLRLYLLQAFGGNRNRVRGQTADTEPAVKSCQYNRVFDSLGIVWKAQIINSDPERQRLPLRRFGRRPEQFQH